MPIDFIFNRQSTDSSLFEKLLAVNFDTGALRPWRSTKDGRSYVTLTQKDGKKKNVLTNAAATLTKDAWKMLDTAVMRAARMRLRAVVDIRTAGLTFNIPNGMGTTVLEYQKMSDTNDAHISMDGLALGQNDRPTVESAFLPLPIIHKDFQFSAREIATGRNTNMPLDTSMGEGAGFKIGELTEKLLLGRHSTYKFGGGVIYGMTNFPGRLTKTITAPNATGWTPQIHLDEVLDMRQTSQTYKHYGPWTLYYSTAWDKYLDGNFTTAYPKSLRARLKEIDGINDVKTLDFLDSATSTYNVVLLEMSPLTVRLVIGMEVQTLEWETVGGLLKNYKAMCIIIPQLRADVDGNTGIVHGATA